MKKRKHANCALCFALPYTAFGNAECHFCLHTLPFVCHNLITVQGIVVDGPIRGSQAMSSMQLGVKTLGTCPQKTAHAFS
jgi:hypothetical protein